MSGIGVNFNVCGFKVITSAVSSAWVGTDAATAATAASRMNSARIRFEQTVFINPPTDSSLRVSRCQEAGHGGRRQATPAFSAPSIAAR